MKAKLSRPEDRLRDERQLKAVRARGLAEYLVQQAECGPLFNAAQLLFEYAAVLGRGSLDESQR